MLNKKGVGDYLIQEDAWECIWEELIINKIGLKTFIDREGPSERDYYFSTEMLDEMIVELDRLISKYSAVEWESVKVTPTLIDLLTEHRGLIVEELAELSSGTRKLTFQDFLGPNTRARMKEEMEASHSYW